MQRGELCYSYGGGTHLGQLRAHLSLRAGMHPFCWPTGCQHTQPQGCLLNVIASGAVSWHTT